MSNGIEAHNEPLKEEDNDDEGSEGGGEEPLS
jgi:hypothetical protein